MTIEKRLKMNKHKIMNLIEVLFDLSELKDDHERIRRVVNVYQEDRANVKDEYRRTEIDLILALLSHFMMFLRRREMNEISPWSSSLNEPGRTRT